MKLNFKYDIQEDIKNFEAVKNYSIGTPIQIIYTEKYGENFDRENINKFIKDFFKKYKIDINEEIRYIENRWDSVNNIFFKRAEKIFDLKLPFNSIIAYLTIHNVGAYNIDKRLFFVSIQKRSSSWAIMHELLHFYTWFAFGEKIKKENLLSREKYYDLTESLTELLNVEFSDLMGGYYKDLGKSQHQKLRESVKKYWIKYKDINKVVEKLLLEI